MIYIRRKGWELPESAITPEHFVLNRRAVLTGSAGLIAATSIGKVQAETMPYAEYFPSKMNAKFADAGRPLTSEADATKFNNFYEFGASKRIAEAAEALVVKPWQIAIDGEVDAPMTLDMDDLFKKVQLEERVIRHRCVEAWAMTVPWTGFPLSQLVALAKPKSDAKFLRFETFNNPEVAPGQKAGLFTTYPWPYVEGLTLAEASNDLAFMVTGAYGKPLPKSMGAPMRLHTPWKYGFKSIKSLVKITFTKERPVSFWETINASEYGFWANVNPEVPHPRWSQASEELLGTGERVPSVIFNGYGEFVADLYKGMENEQLYM
jgi:methionine sulfoxide reductase catalytic subunit